MAPQANPRPTRAKPPSPILRFQQLVENERVCLIACAVSQGSGRKRALGRGERVFRLSSALGCHNAFKFNSVVVHRERDKLLHSGNYIEDGIF